MPNAEQKITQYLEEAHATEMRLHVRDLQSSRSGSPRAARTGKGLEKHLDETRSHAERLEDKRIGELGHRRQPRPRRAGAVESLSAQWLALAKAPFDMLRGSGGEEKVLKNAKESAAAEALEIATYTAIERLADQTGDKETARLAASIRQDEQRMLDFVLGEIPALTEAVAKADVNGRSSYRLSLTDTGAGQSVREIGRQAQEAATGAARRTARAASPKRSETPKPAGTTAAPPRSARARAPRRRSARPRPPSARPGRGAPPARSAPPPPPATGRPSAPRPPPRTTTAQTPAAPTPPADLPIAGYETLTAEGGHAVARLRQFSQAELMRLRAYRARRGVPPDGARAHRRAGRGRAVDRLRLAERRADQHRAGERR